STTKVTGGTFTFDGSAHAASVLVTGVGGLSLTPSPNYSGGCLAAPIHVAETTPTACTASYSFAGDGDHLGSSDSAAIVINPAASPTKVTGGTCTFVGGAHPAGALVAGAGRRRRLQCGADTRGADDADCLHGQLQLRR